MYACIAAAFPLWCLRLSFCLSVSDGELRSACDSSPHTFVLLIGDGVGGFDKRQRRRRERQASPLQFYTFSTVAVEYNNCVSSIPLLLLSRHCSILSFFFHFQRTTTNERMAHTRAMRRIRKKGEENGQHTTDLFQKGE